jgi:hypothetical protein
LGAEHTPVFAVAVTAPQSCSHLHNVHNPDAWAS